MMTIWDRVFGRIEINDPLIERIIALPAFQRLKGINQYGGVNFVFARYQTTRFEHSIGAWHILRSLGASQEVQVAGLLHDIGHRAFSHLIDHVLEDAAENMHELDLQGLPGRAELQAVLDEAGIRLRPVDEYPEIKRSLPAVGADRVDYAMRDYVAATDTGEGAGERLLPTLRLVEREIVFTDVPLARAYAEAGLEAMWQVIYGARVAVVYQAVVEMLRQGLNEGWLRRDDLWRTDAEVLALLRREAHRLPRLYLRLFEEPYTVVEAADDEPHDFRHVKLKARYFDPHILHEERVMPLSELDPTFAPVLQRYVERFEQAKQGRALRVVFGSELAKR